MRIAYICADPGVPVFGHKGSSIHVQEIMRALQRCGANIELFASRLDNDPPADLTQLTIHKLPAIGKDGLARREQRALVANDYLRAALDSAGPFDLVYERYSLWSFAGMEYARQTNTPGLLEVNAPLIEEQAEYRGLVDQAGAEQVAKQAFGAATALLAVSEGVAAYLRNRPETQERVHVIPNGVNPYRFPENLAAIDSASTHQFTIGFVGTLKPWHGLETLVKAFATLHRRHPDTRLLIVGDGPQRTELETKLATYALSHAAHFTGAIAPDEVPGWLASMDVAVAPYPNLSRFYFSPLKVYEYMAARLPVVASRIGQIVEVIEDEVTGLLYPPGQIEALTAKLERLKTNPDLCRDLGCAARTVVSQRYTWDAVVERVLKLAGLETELKLESKVEIV